MRNSISPEKTYMLTSRDQISSDCISLYLSCWEYVCMTVCAYGCPFGSCSISSHTYLGNVHVMIWFGVAF